MQLNIVEELLRDEIDDNISFSTVLWLQMMMLCTVSSGSTVTHGGSRPGRGRNIYRDFKAAHHRIMLDYFWPNDQMRGDESHEHGPVYTEAQFERRFRMPRSMFENLFKSVLMDNDFLIAGLRPDATGKFGATPLQKVVAALRYIAYGTSADGLDEYCKLGESTTLDSMKEFCRSVVRCFGHRYLRPPTMVDLKNIEKQFTDLSFLGCMGCVRLQVRAVTYDWCRALARGWETSGCEATMKQRKDHKSTLGYERLA